MYPISRQAMSMGIISHHNLRLLELPQNVIIIWRRPSWWTPMKSSWPSTTSLQFGVLNFIFLISNNIFSLDAPRLPYGCASPWQRYPLRLVIQICPLGSKCKQIIKEFIVKLF